MSKRFSKLHLAQQNLSPDSSIYCNVGSFGGRHFIVATELAYFTDYFINTTKKAANCEIILQSRPCHLYIDLDVNYNEVDFTVSQVWDELSVPVIQLLREKIGTEEEVDIRIHDSSNDKKGSYHIIIICKNYMFYRNYSVGVFMHMVRKVVEINGNRLLKHCFDQKFIDLSVYSKNRQFRMLGCYKWSKDKDARQKFTRKLVDISVTRNEFNFKNWMYNKVQPVNSEGKRLIQVMNEDGSIPSFANQTFSSFSSNLWEKQIYASSLDFIEQKFGKIRNYKFFPITMSLSVTLDSKTCFFIKNHIHSSNDTRIIINLVRGTYRKKCWSQRCKHQASTPKALPENVKDEVESFLKLPIRFQLTV